MGRSSRLFELIQILSAASQPVIAARLAAILEVSARAVYRDIAALQAMRTLVEGAAGVGYILRPTYDLPPVNFDIKEVESANSMLKTMSIWTPLAWGFRLCATAA